MDAEHMRTRLQSVVACLPVRRAQGPEPVEGQAMQIRSHERERVDQPGRCPLPAMLPRLLHSFATGAARLHPDDCGLGSLGARRHQFLARDKNS